ncbi:MAG: efflux RND transporter periplasmic adaptor subunit [Steroidobacteraceae bacterium]|nr:efflux RND transporter periplasmic adaptor subunit [Steroidobacteraceae bacterium]
MKILSLFAAASTLALLLATAACSPEQPAGATPAKSGEAADHAEGDEQHGDDEGESQSITLDAAALEAAGIRLATLDASVMQEQVRAPGEVLDDAYGTTLVTPRVEGLVVRRHAKLGDEVVAGSPLVTLTSVEVSEAQGQLAIAEQEWQRMESLGPEAVSGRRYAEARITVEQARARARAYGIPGTARGSANGEFTLAAPHAGRITEDSFVVGERIEPGRALFRLVDERIVWIDAKLPAEIAQSVAAGSTATIVAGDARLSGKVLRQAHRTSEATRTAIVRIEVDNRDDRLHAGDYVDVYLERRGESRPQIALPSAALIQLEGESVVFRRNEHGALAPVEVRAGPVMGDHTMIEDGLAIGDTVVVEGAFALKAQLLKAQLGEGHGH